MIPVPSSCIPGIVWPAAVTGNAAMLLALEFQLEQSQWWSAAELEAQQHRQLATLLEHAHASVPWYRKALDEAGWNGEASLTPELWRRIPLLRKDDIRRHQAELRSGSLPAGHGAPHPNKTSGSTGEPLETLSSEIVGLFAQGLTLRDDLWHRRDFSGRLVIIRSGRYAKGPLVVYDKPRWEAASVLPYRTGPMTCFYHRMPVPRQAELLEARSPHYLMAYPSNVMALCRHAQRGRLRLPDLRAVLTYGEPLHPEVRTACRDTWGAPVQDTYACQEVGAIALQCPQCEHYHVQAESVFVEVLDEHGEPCGPGQTGQVVLTALHNFAMPLVRYALGDYAEVGGACACGRGLPVLRRVLGRRRNQVLLPDGSRRWPEFNGSLWAAVPAMEQVQLLQRSLDHVEVHIAHERPLQDDEQRSLGEAIHRALGHPFSLTFLRYDTLARQPNGKHETFICEIPCTV